jgi:hypothetical protein
LDADAQALVGGLKFEHSAHYIVLEDCIAAIEAATARRDRLEAHIEAALSDWSPTPVVEALQALRGLALVANSITRRGAVMIKSASFSKSPNKSINAVALRRNPPHMSGFKESVY